MLRLKSPFNQQTMPVFILSYSKGRVAARTHTHQPCTSPLLRHIYTARYTALNAQDAYITYLTSGAGVYSTGAASVSRLSRAFSEPEAGNALVRSGQDSYRASNGPAAVQRTHLYTATHSKRGRIVAGRALSP